jgi:ribosomal protein S18 acetylase RimI-like enzyme
MFAEPVEANFSEQTSGEEIFVALIDGAVAGFVSVWRPEPFVHFLVVGETHRRCGVGSALLNHAVAVLGTPIDLKCEIHNRAVCAFYEQRGWREVERIEDGQAPYIRYRFG